MIGLREKGFTLVEIMIVVAIIAILSAIAIPNFMAARSKSRANACKANLKQIDSAVEQWAMDASKTNGDSVTMTELIPTYVKKTPVCQAGGWYGGFPVGVDVSAESASANGGLSDNSKNIFIVGGTPGCNKGATAAAGGYPHVLY